MVAPGEVASPAALSLVSARAAASQAVRVRSQLLEAGEILDAAALDRYTFRRDAYLQKRRNDIYDGNPPQDEERYDLEEGEAAAPSPAASEAAPQPGR